MTKSKHLWPTLIALLAVTGAFSQDRRLTIEQCYELAKRNYPLIKKHDLIARSSLYSIGNAGKLNLPQFSVNGQATYQSQTINFAEVLPPVPGLKFPQLSKDQYKIQGEISQQLYDGGAVKNRQDMLRASEAIEQQSLEVNLFALRDRITQLYFSVLLIDEQLTQNDIRRSTLQSAADKAAASLQNGAAFRSNVDELKAEVASSDMSAIELKANRKAFFSMLCLMIGAKENFWLVVPSLQVNDTVVRRPELTLYDLQRNTYDIQLRQLHSDQLPRLNAFVQGAYGRPTLNIIKNEFGPWWLGGLRLSWNLGSFYTLKNNKDILQNNKTSLEVDRETFLFNTHLSLEQQSSEAQKYSALIAQDDTIIVLRTSVTRSAQAQLDNGVITVHDFISKLDAENLARQTRILHQTLMLQAQYNFKNTSGN